MKHPEKYYRLRNSLASLQLPARAPIKELMRYGHTRKEIDAMLAELGIDSKNGVWHEPTKRKPVDTGYSDEE
jgi:hypothetical protein